MQRGLIHTGAVPVPGEGVNSRALIQRRDLKRESTWNGQLHFSSIRGITRDLKYSADSCCPLAHPCQTPVSLTPAAEYLGIDYTSVVPNAHAKVAIGIFHFKLDAVCLGVRKRIDQSFPADAVNLVQDDW